MISPSAIMIHLQTYLPKLTNIFSTELTVTGAIIAGTPQTLRLTSVGHGLSAGDSIMLNDSLINNPITDVTYYAEDGILRFTTKQKHDLTEDYDRNLFEGKVRLSGFTDTDLNTDHTLVSVPSQTMFEIAWDEEVTLNTHELLTEKVEYGLDGIWVIDSVTSSTINIKLANMRTFEVGAVPQIKSVTNIKIDVVIDEDTARSLYKEGYHLFIIMGDGRAGKDRTIDSDANNLNSAGTEQKQEVINEFYINVFLPTANTLTGAEAIDLCWTTLLGYILNCLQGVSFEDDSQYYVSFLSHGSAGKYNKAYYEHSYTFQYVYELDYESSFGYKFLRTAPFEKINISFHEKQEGSYIILNEEE